MPHQFRDDRQFITSGFHLQNFKRKPVNQEEVSTTEKLNGSGTSVAVYYFRRIIFVCGTRSSDWVNSIQKCVSTCSIGQYHVIRIFDGNAEIACLPNCRYIRAGARVIHHLWLARTRNLRTCLDDESTAASVSLPTAVTELSGYIRYIHDHGSVESSRAPKRVWLRARD